MPCFISALVCVYRAARKPNASPKSRRSQRTAEPLADDLQQLLRSVKRLDYRVAIEPARCRVAALAAWSFSRIGLQGGHVWATLGPWAQKLKAVSIPN